MHSVRTSTAITFSVWNALFLREALIRLFSWRAAWLWLLLEPVVHMAYLGYVHSVILVRNIAGSNSAIWTIVGFLGFFLFRRTGTQTMHAISSNQALFGYRQVKPIDTVLVRGGLEGLLMTVIAIILLLGAALLGIPVNPADPLMVLESFFGIWLLGLGYGLVFSVMGELVPEIGRLIEVMMIPLYLISCLIFPMYIVPEPYRAWLLLNPLVHGLETARRAFAPFYYLPPGLSIAYLYGFALVSIFLGLALHHRFALRLTTQ